MLEKWNGEELMRIDEMIDALREDEQSILVIADYLGYSVGKNPNNPTSDWRMLFTDKIPNKNIAILALKVEPGLNISTTTMDIRKLYKQVEQLGVSFGGSFDAEIAGFVGNKRIVLFRVKNGNRDERLDLNVETIDKPIYQDNFNMVKNSSISVTIDDFWGDYVIDGLKDIFKRELTNHFLQMVALYRKKLSELITARFYKEELVALVSDNAKAYIKMNSLTQLVEDESYASVLSSVVDTMILRQLMRRFIEAYYGKDDTCPFEVSGIALGVGKGTLDEAINEAVEVYGQLADESEIQKLNKRKNIIPEIDDDDLRLFDDAEYAATSKIKMKENSKNKLVELHEKATKQFQTIYGGDLFASSIGDVTTRIEHLIVENDPEIWAKFWVDTSSEKYSFRFEDVPPEALEKQYENSMSQNVQIKIEDGKPIVFYGEDLQEQKNKGAYYTDEKFVQYMVRQTVEVEFQNRITQVKEAITNNDENQILKKLDFLFAMKTADLTAGGGSFLRGAFRQLAEKHDALVGLKISDAIRNKYPMLQEGDTGILAWEEYILNHMIYGIDIDYKAILISSLSLMLSSLQHRPVGHELPKLIGKTLIHQNSLMNSTPFVGRKKLFEEKRSEIKKLLILKETDFAKYEKLKKSLQLFFLRYAQDKVADKTQILNIECLEINLPEVFFNKNGILKENAGFDCVIGNPPWEAWKMNYDEFYKKYNTDYESYGLSREKETRKNELQNKFPHIVEKLKQEEEKYFYGMKLLESENYYPYRRHKVNDRYPATETNLYKISTERFLQLLVNGGKLSIIVPDNMMTDIGSTGIRVLLFKKYDLKEFLSFDNKNGIFKSVDTRQRFAVMSVDKNPSISSTFDAFFYKYSLDNLNHDNLKIKYSKAIVKEFEPEKLSLFEPRDIKEFDLYVHLRKKCNSLGNTRLLDFRIEYNAEKKYKPFVYDFGHPNGIPMLKGEFINQFKLVGVPIESFDRKTISQKIGNDIKNYRISIRRNARPTDKRTLICTFLPPNFTASGSMLVQKDSDQMSLGERLFYLGIMNSYIMDFFLRKIIVKNVSQTFLDQLPIPSYHEFRDSFLISRIVFTLLKYDKYHSEQYDDLTRGFGNENLLSLDYDGLIALLNAKVAIHFDLDRNQLISLMKDFESPNHKQFVLLEAQRIIEVFDRLKEGE